MNRNIFKSMVALLFGLFSMGSVFAAYDPPIGIPAPPFGVDEVAPALPSPWDGEVAGFYYIKAGGTNTGYGSPADPRGRIPTPVDPGSVIVIEGEYNRRHDSFTLVGTQEQPIWIVSSPLQQAILKQKISFNGSSYVIMDGVNAVWENSSYNGKLAFRNSDHIVVRNGDFRGDTNKGVGGMGVTNSSYIVFYRNYFHHFGQVDAVEDQDNHGNAIGAGTQYFWALENEYYANSGDGIQVNGKAGDTHHIYIGRNNFHGNGQTGFWAKESSDVIVSENLSHAHRANPNNSSSMGDGMGIQYAPDYVWFLFNKIYDNESGIRFGSNSGGPGTEHFIIGNLIYDIDDRQGFDPTNSWGMAAISLWGGRNTYILNNTIWNAHAGLYTPRASGMIDFSNNIVGPVTKGYQAYYYDARILENSGSGNNIYVGEGQFRRGAREYTFEGFRTYYQTESNSASVTDPATLFVDVSANDFRILPGSAAENKGSEDRAYDIFFERYGIDIRRDIEGKSRVNEGTQWDIGAYEIDAPDAPAMLEATVLP